MNFSTHGIFFAPFSPGSSPHRTPDNFSTYVSSFLILKCGAQVANEVIISRGLNGVSQKIFSRFSFTNKSKPVLVFNHSELLRFDILITIFGVVNIKYKRNDDAN
jgi:hypothetical protein